MHLNETMERNTEYQREQINLALVRLDEAPLESNDAFNRLSDDQAFPFAVQYRLVRPGAAPLRFCLGGDFQVDVGGLSEWIHAPARDETIAEQVTDALTCSFVVRRGRPFGVVLTWTDAQGRRGTSRWFGATFESGWTGRSEHSPAFPAPEVP